MTWWMWLILIVSAYVAGSIPFGVIIGRLRGVDIRQHGSRNIGATNVGRVLGRKWGTLCFALDMLKGAIPVLIAGFIANLVSRDPMNMTHREMWLWLAVGAAAIVGHMASIFLRFRGGKGIATGFGAILAMWPLLTIPAIFAFIVWYTMLRLVKYVSVASMTAAASLPIAAFLYEMPSGVPLKDALADALHIWPVLVTTTALALVVVWKHRANIARLRRGEEPRVRLRKTGAAEQRSSGTEDQRNKS